MDNVLNKIKKIEKEHLVRLVKRAQEMGVEVNIVSERDRIYQLCYNNLCRYIIKSGLPFNTNTVNLVPNKQLTKDVLVKADIKVARGMVVKDYEELESRLNKGELKYPLVVKPIDAMKGLGVTVNIKDKESLKRAVKEVENFWKTAEYEPLKEILVEEFFEGDDFRFLVLKGKTLAVAERKPGQIKGDGKKTTKQLIDDFNSGKTFNHKRNKFNMLYVDKEAKDKIKEAGYNLESVLPENKILKLRGKANISAGGICVNMTEKAHKKFKEIAEKAVNTCGLNWAGVDILTKDITNPNSDYILVEINGAPDYFLHEECDIGESRDIAGIIIKEMFE